MQWPDVECVYGPRVNLFKSDFYTAVKLVITSNLTTSMLPEYNILTATSVKFRA